MDTPSRVLDFVHQRLQIDEEWSTRQAPGFTWWAGELRQRLWAENPRNVQDIDVTAVHIETDLLTSVRFTADTFARLASINQLATLSAYMAYPAEGAVRLHASVSVTADNWPVARALALHAAAVQVADAHAEAQVLAGIFDADVDRSSPAGNPRTEPDEMLAVVEVYRQHGAERSPFGVDELASLVHLEPRPWTRASSSSDALAAELPYAAGAVAHLELDAAWRHPALGSGLQMRLFVPEEASASNAHRLNEAERTQPDAHQLGAWCVDEARGLGFVSFLPAAAYLPALSRGLVYHMAARCQWAGVMMTG